MLDWSKHPNLQHAREHSQALLGALREHLAELRTSAPEVVTVAVSGSIGRLEALAHSDCDLIVVVADGTDPRRCDAVMRTTWAALAPLQLPAPVSSGIYARPGAPGALLDPNTRGKVADDVDAFGKRMQLLLDARPVYRDEAFASLQRAVLERYASGFLERDPGKEWSYLLNDLQRYFRAYCVFKQWDFARDNSGWYLRSVKLRHSRVLMYAGLLLLLGECSKERQDKLGWLRERLSLPPLERVASVYLANEDPHFERIARTYDRFLALLRDPAARATLIEAAPERVEDLDPTGLPAYVAMRENAAQLSDELIRFVLARRGDWSPAFFRYLLF